MDRRFENFKSFFYFLSIDQKNSVINRIFYQLQTLKPQKAKQKTNMVKLSFTVYVPAPLPNVWAFFSKFENVSKWDPNTTSVIPKKETSNKIGSLYDVKTLFKGEEKELEYKMIEYQEFKKIVVEGQNFSTRTVDEINFEEKAPGTNVTYIADIQLRHVLKIFTPFIRKDLDKIAETAEQGFRKKSAELFGK